VDLELTERGRVDGSLLDRTGRPAAGFTVCVAGGEAPDARSRDRQCADTDGGGRFAISGLSAGTYAPSVRGQPAQPWPVVTLSTSAATASIELRLAIDAGRTIEGRVARPDGGTLLAEVRLDHDAVEVTDRGGRFRFDRVHDGEHALDVRSIDGWLGRLEKVSAGAGDVVISLAQGASIAGTIRAASGSCERYSVLLRGPSGWRMLLADDGEFLAEDLAPGSYTVNAICVWPMTASTASPRESADALLERGVKVTIKAGERSHLVLEPDGSRR
jgi:hypothetical protein